MKAPRANHRHREALGQILRGLWNEVATFQSDVWLFCKREAEEQKRKHCTDADLPLWEFDINTGVSATVERNKVTQLSPGP